MAGQLRGRNFKVSKGMRVVEARIRKVLYDVLSSGIEGRVVLDIFAGAGSLGIEALSWGAKEAIFVEKDRNKAKLIKDNLVGLNLISHARVFQEDVFSFISRTAGKEKQFDFIFLDPPYKENILTKTLKYLADYDILTPQTFVVSLGSIREKTDTPQKMQRVFLRCYGDRRVEILRKNESFIPGDI